MSQSEIEACMNDTELALRNLSLLLASVNHEEESISNAAIEALENCGPPAAEHSNTILNFLNDSDSLRTYWAATLLGRLFLENSKPDGGLLQQASNLLDARLIDHQLDESAREKVCWAITNLPVVDWKLKQTLQSMSPAASPRMLRLIENALSKP